MQVKKVYRSPIPFAGWFGFEPGLNLSFEYGEQLEWDLDKLEEDQESRSFQIQNLHIVRFKNRDLRNARAHHFERRTLLNHYFRTLRTLDSKNVPVRFVDWEAPHSRTVSLLF